MSRQTEIWLDLKGVGPRSESRTRTSCTHDVNSLNQSVQKLGQLTIAQEVLPQGLCRSTTEG